MLEIKNLSFTVPSDREQLEIVRNVDLTVEDGELLVITGPNGGGKSTLAKLIMGIETATEGQILLDGVDITALSLTERARLGIGYAFQQPPRFKGLTVRRLLSLAHGRELPDDACCSYLTRVGLCSKDYLNRPVDGSFSGGELKRIEIASLMARDLKVAIYDEPEAGIDLWSFTMLVESFKNMVKDRKQSVVIISHQERILRLADRIAIIAGGIIKEVGPGKEMMPRLMSELDERCSFRGGSAK